MLMTTEKMEKERGGGGGDDKEVKSKVDNYKKNSSRPLLHEIINNPVK